MAPASRSSATASMFARMIPPISATRRPTRRRTQQYRWLCGDLPRKQSPEVGVRGDHDAILGPCQVHDHIIGSRRWHVVPHMHGVMAFFAEQGGDLEREVVVDQKSHAECLSGNSRSRTASAAYRKDSVTSSGVRSGRSEMISSVLIPSATIATTVATGIRIPRMHGTPPITSGSVVIRSNVTRRC